MFGWVRSLDFCWGFLICFSDIKKAGRSDPPFCLYKKPSHTIMVRDGIFIID